MKVAPAGMISVARTVTEIFSTPPPPRLSATESTVAKMFPMVTMIDDAARGVEETESADTA